MGKINEKEKIVIIIKALLYLRHSKFMKKEIIPYFEDINQFLASVPIAERTNDPLFYCYRLNKTNPNPIYKPPFRRGFYFLGLLTNAEKTKITYDNTST